MSPSETDHRPENEPIPTTIVYLNAEDFKRTTLGFGNPGGASAFAVAHYDTFTGTVYVDQDIFKVIRTTGGEDYSDIMPYVIEHEIEEIRLLIEDRRLGIERTTDSRIDNSKFDQARYKAMTSAFRDGKLDKYLEFQIFVQMVAQRQIDEYWGHSQKNQEDLVAAIYPYILKNTLIADRVKRDQTGASSTTQDPDSNP